jgi:hypothetical protein
VATLVPSRNEAVQGLLYELPRAELSSLDQYEGHPFNYERKLVFVQAPTSGRPVRAHTYVLPVAEESPPSLAYFSVIWLAYRTLGFDRAPLLTAASLSTREGLGASASGGTR